MLKRPRLPTRKEPSQRRAQATRSDILAATNKALQMHGANVSMTRIAEIAGYGIGTLYQYYPNREALLCDLMAALSDELEAAMMAQLPAMQSEPLADAVARVVGVFVSSISQNRELYIALLRDVIPSLPSAAFEDRVPTFAPLLSQLLADKRSELRTSEFDMAAFFALHAAQSVLHETVLEHPDWLDAPDFEHEVRALVLGYLAARDSRVDFGCESESS